MVDCILITGRDTATVYFVDGRMPFTVKVDSEVLLDVVRNLVYTDA